MDAEAARFEKSVAYSFEHLKSPGQVAFPTLAALMDPPMSVVPPAGGDLYLQPGVLPPARDLWDRLVELANRKKEETIWELLRPTARSPTGTKLEDLEKDAEIDLIEGKTVVSVPVNALVQALTADSKGVDARDLPGTPVFFRGSLPNKELVLSIDKSAPYLHYVRLRDKALAEMDAISGKHLLPFLALGRTGDEEMMKNLAEFYEVDVDRGRRNVEVLDQATDLAPALREATPPATLKLAWLPDAGRRDRIRQEMEKIAEPALRLGAALATRLSSLLTQFDLPEPPPGPAPDMPAPEGGGSSRA
jgi:hypothetical protein